MQHIILFIILISLLSLFGLVYCFATYHSSFQISPKPLCLTLDMIRTGLVAKSQPAAIKLFDYYQPSKTFLLTQTVLPAKSDSDVMFVYKVIRDLISKDHLCINPIRWIGLIHNLSLDSHMLKWYVQVNVLLNNCIQILRHCHFWLARQ